MSVPTQGECFAKLLECIRMAQEHSAMIAHLNNANDNRQMALGWLATAELFKKIEYQVIKLGQGKLQ